MKVESAVTEIFRHGQGSSGGSGLNSADFSYVVQGINFFITQSEKPYFSFSLFKLRLIRIK